MENPNSIKNPKKSNNDVGGKIKSNTRSKKKKSLKMRKKQSQTSENNSDRYLDLGSVGRGFVILGSILLLIYMVYYLITINPAEGSIWDDAYAGDVDAINSALPLSIILITIGIIFYFFHYQFVRLSEFALEVESGEFEKKIMKELEMEGEK